MLPATMLLAASLLAGSAPVELVETAPLETTLDHPEIPEAATVWLEMIDAAERSIELAHFYAVDRPGSRLEKVVEALERAAKRGVKIRFLADKGFYDRTYKETLDRLGKQPGVTLRLLDAKQHYGGVQHAKYMLIDVGRPGEQSIVGSQNFDWRSLEHIQELGLRVRVPGASAALADVFEYDWALAGGEKPPLAKATQREFAIGNGDRLRFVASPKGFLPDEAEWDLPGLLAMIDGAKATVRVQLLSHAVISFDKSYFAELDDALRRAAARGVKVELLLANWNQRANAIWQLQSLAHVPNLAIKMLTVPEAKEGFIPFGRVIHAKYMVVDGHAGWIGTSNWAGDYFLKSRNVGWLVEGEELPAALEGFFATGWNSSYAAPLDPCRVYPEPRVGE